MTARVLPWLYAVALAGVATAVVLAAVATGSTVVAVITTVVVLTAAALVVAGVRRLRQLEIARLKAERHSSCSCCSNAADDVTVTDAETGACGSVCGGAECPGTCALSQSTATTTDVTA